MEASVVRVDKRREINDGIHKLKNDGGEVDIVQTVSDFCIACRSL